MEVPITSVSFDQLPEGKQFEIFSFSSPEEVANNRLVCPAWNRRIDKPHHMERILCAIILIFTIKARNGLPVSGYRYT